MMNGTERYSGLNDERWEVFSLWAIDSKNKFQPLVALSGFLPRWLEACPNITCWHILFEPQALIRFQCAEDYYIPYLNRAEDFCDLFGLWLTHGDASPEVSRNAYPYQGEANVYGRQIWEANKKFMQACAELSIAFMNETQADRVWLEQKFLHLFCNIMGADYAGEHIMCKHRADRAYELYKEMGRMF
jgi:hypothetical protein